MKDNAPSNLVQEAERLTGRVFDTSPTRRAAVYSRCLESLGWIQEKAWEATDAKWQEIYGAEQEIVAALQSENERLREALEPTSYADAHGCCDGDCPHGNTNGCVLALTNHISGLAIDARTALKTEPKKGS